LPWGGAYGKERQADQEKRACTMENKSVPVFREIALVGNGDK
jgi:hypothetical protein